VQSGHWLASLSVSSELDNVCSTTSAPSGLRFELFVDDVPTTVRFYGRLLGLLPPPGWSPEGYVRLHAGAVTIGVQKHSKLPSDHYFSPSHLAGPRGVGVEIVIEIDSVDTVYHTALEEVARLGGQIEPLADRPWGARDFRLVDPDGYYVRVSSRAD
jgi:lactoylglutathione lyase